MDDQQVLSRIDELVQEEEQLLHRHEGETGLSPEEHSRLEELKVALDQAWEDTPVSFGPDSACKDGIVARVRGAMRPAPGLSLPSR